MANQPNDTILGVSISRYNSAGVFRRVAVSEITFGPLVLRKAGTKLVRSKGTDGNYESVDDLVIPEDCEANWLRRRRCHLIKAINSVSAKGSRFTFYADGFRNGSLVAGDTAFTFDKDLQDGPVVDFDYRVFGTRNGAPKIMDLLFARMTFRDEEQMREYVVATAVPDPSDTTRSEHSSSVSSSDDSTWPLVAAAAVAGFAIANS